MPILPTLTRRRLLAGLGASSLLGPSGCALWPRPATVPLPVQAWPSRCGPRADTLVLLLPGAASPLQEFIDEGFVSAVHSRGFAVDVRLVDLHLGYFRAGTAIERLHTDVLRPARRQGWRQVWLAGISLGGFGALSAAMAHGAEVDGVLALAPYLGRAGLLQQIGQQGPAAWLAQRPAAALAGAPASQDEAEARLWHWLLAPPAGAPPLHLGFGVDDRLAEGHRLLAAQLPAGRVMTVPGGHDWPPWRALWTQWLDRRAPWPRGCPPATAA